MSITVERTIQLVSLICGRCDVTFAMPDYLQRECKDKGRTFYCPNGHPRVYRTSENDLLRKQLEVARTHATHLADQCDAAERSARAYKGQATKLKKRAAAGVCPCCQRSFVELQRHMANKHPHFVAEHANG